MPPPIGYWPLDEGSGATTADLSGNNTRGTLSGSPMWVAGKKGFALVFNGSNFVGLGRPPVLQLTGAMTVSAWVNVSASPGRAGNIITKQSGYPGWTLLVMASGAPGFSIARDSMTMVGVQGPPVPLRTWVHLAGVFEPGASIRLYVDGEPVVTKTDSVPTSQYNNPNDYRIGLRPDLLDGFLGSIDDVRVYDRALSDAEVATLVQ